MADPIASPQSARLICYPQLYAVGHARRAAADLWSLRTEEDRQAGWEAITNSLADRLEDLGFDDAEIKSQLAQFYDATKRECIHLRDEELAARSSKQYDLFATDGPGAA
jgi:hypothetical protein